MGFWRSLGLAIVAVGCRQNTPRQTPVRADAAISVPSIPAPAASSNAPAPEGLGARAYRARCELLHTGQRFDDLELNREEESGATRVDQSPTQLEIGDVDRDGDADVLWGGRWLLQDETHAFDVSARFTLPPQDTIDAAWGDVDRDGKADVVVASGVAIGGANCGLWLRRGRAPSQFSAPQLIAGFGAIPGSCPSSPSPPAWQNSRIWDCSSLGVGVRGLHLRACAETLALSDLNRDHRLDLIHLVAGRQRVDVGLGDGSGGFRPGESIELALEATRLIPLDVGRAGRRRFLLVAEGGILMLTTDRKGRLGLEPKPVYEGEVRNVASVDLNRDHLDDLLIIGGVALAVWLASEDGQFHLRKQYFVGDASRVVARDLDADGATDLILDRPQGESIGWSGLAWGRGSAEFSLPEYIPLAHAGEAMATGDLDRDGHPDFVTTAGKPARLSILFGEQAGGFEIVTLPEHEVDAVDLELSDVNADGKLDLVVAAKDGRLMLALGVGERSLGPWVPLAIDAKASRVLPARLNLDRIGDVLVIDDSGKGVSMLLGGPAGLTPAGGRLALVDKSGRVHPVDIDGDGRDELVSGDPRSVVYQLDATQSWAKRERWSEFDHAATRADVNHDKIPDLVSTCPIRVWLGKKPGVYLSGVEHSGGCADFESVFDIDRDGQLDVVTVGTDELTVTMGIGDGNFWAPTSASLLHKPHDPRFATVTRDTAWDLADVVPDAGLVVYEGCDGKTRTHGP